MTNLETLKQQTTDLEAKLKEMKAEIERLENGWEMKCPYEYDDEYFIVESSGRVGKCSWDGLYVEEGFFNQGHIFLSEEEALLEAKRRNLLTRFKAFRDECNGDWKPDWSNSDEKWEIDCLEEKVVALWVSFINSFSTFGYFKNKQDAQHAVELFGDEIKELFVD